MEKGPYLEPVWQEKVVRAPPSDPDQVIGREGRAGVLAHAFWFLLCAPLWW